MDDFDLDAALRIDGAVDRWDRAASVECQGKTCKAMLPAEALRCTLCGMRQRTDTEGTGQQDEGVSEMDYPPDARYLP